MALVLPLRSSPGVTSYGQNAQTMIAVGYMTADMLGFTLPLVITAGTSVTSNQLLVSGWDAFMMIVTFTAAGGSSTFSYDILDPADSVSVLINRSIVAGLVPQTAVISFGAGAFTAPLATRSDTFHTIQIKIAANTNNQTFSAIRLWMGIR